MDSPPENDVCSVCHDDFTIPCQANCSHWFCAHCILGVWHHGYAHRPCTCPICRGTITLLIPSEAAQQERHDPEVGHVLGNIERYNRMFGGGPPNLTQMLQDLPFFLRRLLTELMDPHRSLPFFFIARMVLAFIFSGIYVLSPVDIIPEGVLGFAGFFDDLLVVLVVFLYLAAMYRTILLNRHGG